MTQLIKAAALGGLTVYLWGMISWMVLPWHNHVIQPFNHDADVATVLDFATPSSGVFVIPSPQTMKNPTPGPMVFASISKSGHRPMAQAVGMGLITQILGALLAAWLLSKTQGLSYKQKVLFVSVFGVAAGWLGAMPYFIWWSFPAGYTAVMLADSLIGWALAGFVIGKII